MDVDNIKERILEFLKSENKSSAHFAQEIGVQPSAISHIISGRNKPSLDFVIKMINRYPSLSIEWLLLGKGSMHPDKLQTELLFEELESDNRDKDLISPARHDNALKVESVDSDKSDDKNPESPKPLKNRGKAARIIVFYNDNTFTEHFPGGE